MTKSEFLKLQKEDIATLNNAAYHAVLEFFEEFIPANANIGNDKSVDGMYKFMLSYAKSHQQNGNFCVDPTLFKTLMFDYLCIVEKEESKNVCISLEDIFI